MREEKLKIIFMGTPEFGAIILDGLINSQYKPYAGRWPNGPFRPILVVTMPDKPVGREQIVTPPPVKTLAEKYKISVAQPEKISDLSSQISDLKPDLIIVAAYGQIIPKEILDIPKHGCLNVHPSLLPRWRGASPIQYAILNGDEKTGVTIFLVDEKMDHGPILNQRIVEIADGETGGTLHDKLVNFGKSFLIDTISKWQRGLIKLQPQDEDMVTYSKILTREDGRIIWKKNAQNLEREIRAFDPWPGSFTFWPRLGKLLRIKILKARVFKSTGGISFPIGKTLVVPQNEIAVQCGGGFLSERGDFLVIEKLQLEGKTEMCSEDFIRGHLDFIGTILK